MYFKRDIWNKLLSWKNSWDNVTLEVRGARQVGKTYILTKFCSENFKNFIYINMADNSGKIFLSHINALRTACEKGEKKGFKVSDLLEMYDSEFEDSYSTVVLIDEIQESSSVYNLIRSFTRELKSWVIITGSYLGKTLDKDFFIPVGDIMQVTLHPLSFAEFLDIFGMRERQYECYHNFKADDELRTLFNLYTKLGGYPAVIEKYMLTKDFTECENVRSNIINMFISESLRYFQDISDVSVFRDLLRAVAVLMVQEKQGSDLIKELSKITIADGTSKMNKKVIERAIAWLHVSGIIGYASKMMDGDALKISSHARFYFNDIGMARYFMTAAVPSVSSIKGTLAENYVFTVLRDRFYSNELGDRPSTVIGFEPMFSTYSKTGGELDFILCGKFDGKKIGIEVKAKRGNANTGKTMLADRKIDQLYLLEGSTGGGESGKITTLPLYLADQLEFDFERLTLSLNLF